MTQSATTCGWVTFLHYDFGYFGAESVIVIDVDNDGLALTNPAGGVVFDALAAGSPVRVAWTLPGTDDGFLALDRNVNGLIDDGSERFGNFTDRPAPAKREERNGFLALAVFDLAAQGGNADGQITEEDRVYGRLRVWFDANHDGASHFDELKTLDELGIRALSLHYVNGRRTDAEGNLLRFRGHVTMDKDAFEPGPFKRQAVDVVLSYAPAR